MENSSLKKLKELTGKLLLSDMEKTKNARSHKIEYDIKNGKGITWGIYKTEAISVLRFYSTKGSTFPLHFHVEKEYSLIYQGSIRLFTKDNSMIKKKGDFWIVEPNVEHGCEVLEDCWIVSMTIPGSLDWPEAL